MGKNKSYNILIVEDNPGDFLLVEDYIDEEMSTSSTYKAESFKDAWQILNTRKTNMDVVLLDLSLPDKEGEDLINEMVKVADEIPMIILTGYTNLGFAAHALSLGASDYLVKDNLNPTVLFKSIIYNIERNKYLVRIKESEQRYSDLFHLSPQPKWVFDINTLEFLDVNESAEINYGYSSEEFFQMSLEKIIPNDDMAAFRKRVDQLRKGEINKIQGEYRHKTKRGKEIIVDVRSNVINYADRRAVLVLANDITERYKHIKAIEEQNQRLREIAWTQSHVLRAPVARIMGLVQIMDIDSNTFEEKEEIIRLILDAATELDSIIKNIVKKSREIDIFDP